MTTCARLYRRWIPWSTICSRVKAQPENCLKTRRFMTRLQKTLTDVHKIVTDLNEGKGTAGKLLKSDDLHQQISGSLTKVDLIIDKVNSGQGTIGPTPGQSEVIR